MKKIGIVLVLVASTMILSNDLKGQANWEVGVRGFDLWSVEATIPLAASPRLHPAVYFDRFGIGGYFDWMFALSGGPTGLKFFPGVGPEFWFGSDFDFDIAGDFGVEYSFKFPLTLGIDWRPAFRLTDSFSFRSGNWGISARFRFGEGAKFEKTD